METQTIVDLVLNHYRNAERFGYKGLVNFLRTAGREVFERELSEEELERVFCAAMVALFND
jgi:nitrogenase molybdenum-iron protein alpha/beta subunit